MFTTSFNVGDSLYSSDLWITFTYPLENVFVWLVWLASGRISADTHLSRTRIQLLSCLRRLVIVLSSGTAGSRGSRTSCLRHFLYLCFFMCLGFTLTFLPVMGAGVYNVAQVYIPTGRKSPFSRPSADKSWRDCEQPAGNRCHSPNHLHVLW